MNLSTALFGPRFDPELAESQWEAVLATDPSATTAIATWPAAVDSQLARQADLSSYVSRSLRKSLVLAILATLLFPAAAALLYEPVRPWAFAICSGNVLTAAWMWFARLRFAWPWPQLQAAPQGAESAWGPVAAANDLRIRAQLATYSTVARLLTLAVVWMSVVTLVAAVMALGG